MGISVRRGPVVSAIAFVALAGMAAPAHAQMTSAIPPLEDPVVVNTEPPVEPEESGLVEDPADPEPLPEETGPPSKPGDKPSAEYCRPSRIYTPTSKGGQYHKAVGATNSNYNGTSRTARSTFTSEVTGEVGVGVTAGLETSIDVMVAKIEAKYEVNLTVKLTAKLGNSIAVDTPAKKTTNAKYGVYRLKHTGTSYVIYSNCNTSTKKKVTSYTPLKVGWYLWES
ncbi:hypothetical protein ACIHCQ_42480 [Streptomyces sp. NPDC052236]|uniref:hypothetical protein n=1 Tax=Streptomyces sp. NPDC052236 TaxID=3365686 RepID=UPI0037D8B288